MSNPGLCRRGYKYGSNQRTEYIRSLMIYSNPFLSLRGNDESYAHLSLPGFIHYRRVCYIATLSIPLELFHASSSSGGIL